MDAGIYPWSWWLWGLTAAPKVINLAVHMNDIENDGNSAQAIENAKVLPIKGARKRTTKPRRIAHDDTPKADQRDPNAPERATIVYTKSAPDLATNALIDRLVECKRLFRRGRLAVFVSDKSAVRPGSASDGGTEIAEASDATIAYIASANVQFVETRRKTHEDGTVETYEAKIAPPKAVVAQARAVGPSIGLLPIEGVLRCPVMCADGTIINDNGYHEKTGYYQTGANPEAVPRGAPDFVAARAALESLLHLFRGPGYDREGKRREGFPWANPERDPIVPIAAILTMLARPAFEQVPAFLIDASMPGSGKGKVVSPIHAIVMGRAPSTGTWPIEKEEQEKVLASVALAGTPIWCVDDIVGEFGSASLQNALTTESYSGRILGSTNYTSMSWKTMILATGNNLQLYRDMPRRCIVARLEPESDQHNKIKDEDFWVPGIVEHALAERAKYIKAGLTILQAYHLAGRPNAREKNLGSFEGWAQLIGGALRWVGAGDITEYSALERVVESDEMLAVRTILTYWPGLDHGLGMALRGALDHLWPSDGDDELMEKTWGSLRAALRSLDPRCRGNQKPEAATIGKVLKGYRKRPMRRLDGSGPVYLEAAKNPSGAEYSPVRWTAKEAGK